MSRKLMISAGEASGEMYGAMMSRAVKQAWPDTYIFGIGGSRMEEEGVSIIAPISHILGAVEAIRHLRQIRITLNKAKEALVNNRPDLLVLIDYPDFNLTLAKYAKQAGIPILYYVSPQVWAWRQGRVKKIASLVNRMAVLFPFEVQYYNNTGLPCEFVGHPIIERINITGTKEELIAGLGLDPNKQVITLLPGSRPNEIAKHETLIMEIAEKIHIEFPDKQIVVPLAPGTKLSKIFPEYVKVVHGRTTEAVACSEVSAVTSGTATLETALVGTPMVVFYKISPITFLLGRILTNLKFISLVNILSDKAVVRELLQKDANADSIFSELRKILTDTSYRNNMKAEMKKILDMMQGKKPSARVAEIAGEMAGWN